jgi:hypothetical protein
MSTVHIPRLRLHVHRRTRTTTVADAGSRALALGGVAALVALPAGLVAVSLLLP